MPFRLAPRCGIKPPTITGCLVQGGGDGCPHDPRIQTNFPNGHSIAARYGALVSRRPFRAQNCSFLRQYECASLCGHPLGFEFETSGRSACEPPRPERSTLRFPTLFRPYAPKDYRRPGCILLSAGHPKVGPPVERQNAPLPERSPRRSVTPHRRAIQPGTPSPAGSLRCYPDSVRRPAGRHDNAFSR